MADHMSYMHKSFPRSQDNEHAPHLRHEHSVTHEDPHIRTRHEGHSAGAEGAGTIMSAHGNRGTV